MRGWLTCLVVFSLMIMTPFQDPQIALASDFVEELQWSQFETELLGGNSLEWHLEAQATDVVDVTEDVAVEEIAMEAVANVEPIQEEEILDESAQAEMSVEEIVVEESVEVAADTNAEKDAEVEEELKATRRVKEIGLPQWRISINAEQMDLLERCVMAEGGGESYECQVAIACVIINRVLSEKYPSTIEEVIKQPGQFSTWPTMIENMTATNQVKQAVREALANEVLPENVLYFRANRYHRWGTRYCRINNTYFSTP